MTTGVLPPTSPTPATTPSPPHPGFSDVPSLHRYGYADVDSPPMSPTRPSPRNPSTGRMGKERFVGHPLDSEVADHRGADPWASTASTITNDSSRRTSMTAASESAWTITASASSNALSTAGLQRLSLMGDDTHEAKGRNRGNGNGNPHNGTGSHSLTSTPKRKNNQKPNQGTPLIDRITPRVSRVAGGGGHPAPWPNRSGNGNRNRNRQLRPQDSVSNRAASPLACPMSHTLSGDSESTASFSSAWREYNDSKGTMSRHAWYQSPQGPPRDVFYEGRLLPQRIAGTDALLGVSQSESGSEGAIDTSLAAPIWAAETTPIRAASHYDSRMLEERLTDRYSPPGDDVPRWSRAERTVLVGPLPGSVLCEDVVGMALRVVGPVESVRMDRHSGVAAVVYEASLALRAKQLLHRKVLDGVHRLSVVVLPEHEHDARQAKMARLKNVRKASYAINGRNTSGTRSGGGPGGRGGGRKGQNQQTMSYKSRA